MVFLEATSRTLDTNNNGIETSPLLQQRTGMVNIEAGTCFSSTAPLLSEFFDSDSVSTTVIAKQEASLLIWSGIPLALAYLLQFSFTFTNTLSLGHLGTNELAAAALGNMTLFMFINAPAVGLATALDTFCSTAFTASSDKTLVGFHLQCGYIAVIVHFLFVLPILANIEPILIVLNQDPTISHLCGRFVYVQLFGLLPWMFFECTKRFVQAQGHMKASTYILMIVLPLHLLNTYLFVWSPVGFGFLGAAAANVVTFCAMFVGIIIYSWKSSARAAWGGWTRRSFAAMPQFYSLAIPSMIMVCSEWIGWELMAIASSYLGNVTLVAQSIVINTCTLTYQPVNGLRVAITNRIGNLLGQTRARRSKIASAVGICLGTVSGLVSLALYIIAANWWGRIYSTDLDVVAAVALVMPACGVFQLLDSVTSATSGIIRSIGRQTAGAWISIPSYYIIGLPLGLYLTYGRPAMGVLGLWIGLCIAIFITVSGQLFICLGVNYAEEVKRCLAQVNNSQNLANSESSE